MIFDPVEASTPPCQATPPVAAPPSPPPVTIEMRPTWVIKLEQDLVKIQQQQQTVMVKEAEDDKALFYAEGTPQPLTEVPAFPGQYQIEFPREQIEGETNSDISEIEDIEPIPIPPRDTRPSGFTMPPLSRRFTPLPPRQFTPPPVHIQPFPEPSFRSWLADDKKKKELLDELDINTPSIASQLNMYLRLKDLQSSMMSARLDIINLKKQMKEEAE